MTATLQLTLKNDMAEHARLAAALSDWAEAEGIDPGLATTFELAFDEILANITSYAYDDPDAEHAIEVACRWDGATLSAEVVDEGRPFDPLAAPDPDLEAGLEERAVGGLGLFLVRQLMDEVAYRRDGPRNRLSFAKKPAAEDQ
ncbi:MAG: ATP-binding protein [Tistlia sp.]|uniref:ATP-binding protein n=1 Tax=Tistlia sp. TaxID=3057121 RepID=UPI0034A10637